MGATAGGFIVSRGPVEAWLAFAPVVFFIALPAWAMGLLLIGLPFLGLLHASPIRSGWASAAVGALLAGLVEMIWLRLPTADGRDLIVGSLVVVGQALAGAIVGWIAARVAYGAPK